MRLREQARSRLSPQQIQQPVSVPSQKAEEADEVKDL
jgi:hypothetical protein